MVRRKLAMSDVFDVWDEGCGEGRKGRTFYCLRIGSLTLDLDITLIQILLKVKLYSGL